MSLADRIQQRLNVLKMNQATLARSAGVKPASVNNWLSGKTKTLKGESLLRAASALKCNPRWLSSGIGPAAPEDAGVPAAAHEPAPAWGSRSDDVIEECVALLRRLDEDARMEALQWLRGFAAGRKTSAAPKKRGGDSVPSAAAAG